LRRSRQWKVAISEHKRSHRCVVDAQKNEQRFKIDLMCEGSGAPATFAAISVIAWFSDTDLTHAT
jgi:hypothetical protein